MTNTTNIRDLGKSAAPDTRERILDAAEVLFVEHGFDATSMRMITSRANVNLAAINYHFGNKETLIGDVFRRRLGPLAEQSIAALDELEHNTENGQVKPSQIVQAFFGTAIKIATDTKTGDRHFMKLLGRIYSEPNEAARNFLNHEFSGCVKRFLGALYHALPNTPRSEILWRFHFMMGALSYAMTGSDLLGLNDVAEEGRNSERLMARLMSFLLGGLRAPLPDFSSSGNQSSDRAA